MPLGHIKSYIEELKSKPSHVRRNIAVASSSVVTAMIALLWMVSLTSSGVLALKNPGEPILAAGKDSQADFGVLVGAAAAFRNSVSGAGELTVVETSASSTLDEKPEEERTVIPF